MITQFRYVSVPVDHVQREVATIPEGMQLVFSAPTPNGVTHVYEDVDSPLDMGYPVYRMSRMAFLLPADMDVGENHSPAELANMGATPLQLHDVFEELEWDTTHQMTRQELQACSLIY